MTWLHRLRVSFHIRIVSKAPALPPLPTTGGSFVLSKDGKRWDPQTPEPPALNNDGTLAQQDDLGESRGDLRDTGSTSTSRG